MNNSADEPKELTLLINAALAGDTASAEAAFAHTYPELCRLARLRLSPSARGSSLDTRALVHESFLRFSRLGELAVEDRAHFYRYAGRVMRSVIVDLARQRGAERHGGGLRRVEFTEGQSGEPTLDVLELHQALEQLAEHDPQMVQVVELKFFGGMTEGDIAAAMGVTDRTVRRIWTRARVWLKAFLSGMEI